jgi:uncharacterized protein (DUF924 family)
VQAPVVDAERIENVLRYWFGDAQGSPVTLEAMRGRLALWFGESNDTDDHVRRTFAVELEDAAAGRLEAWADTPRGRLALVVVCDQFSRNAYRGTPRAFALDDHALALAEAGLSAGASGEMNAAERVAFYLPLMHAEDRARQHKSLELYRRLFEDSPTDLHPALSLVVEAAERHARIVERFGRYPHRNDVLGRATTEEEAAFMKQPDSSYQPSKR